MSDRFSEEARCPRCESEELRLKDKKLRSIIGITHGNVPSALQILVF